MDLIKVEIMVFEEMKIAIVACFMVEGRKGYDMYIPLWEDSLSEPMTRKPPCYNIYTKYTREPTPEERIKIELWRNILGFHGYCADIVPTKIEETLNPGTEENI